MKTIISASLLSADFSDLGRECDRAAAAGCDWLHFDIMDGMFVPSISFGGPVLRSVAKISRIPVDVHMMTVEPVRYIRRYAELGASRITIHAESTDRLADTLEGIKLCGIKAGVAIKPDTPVADIEKFIPLVDMVLIMTVEPGFGGQEFMPRTLEKIRLVRFIAEHQGIDLNIQVDGGINAETAPLVREAGANVLVSGSYLFGAGDMSAAVASLR
ncbi:MAG: ribulose-phosphate 3-epimerase [Ruminococcus sp.]|nr:ribulose-phosphate 3-epimerase [Ruminococcus sp.]